ncbi:MAG TPA: PrpF domain-containing protein, partial [Ktedonobacteraceae bacterium]
TGAAATLPGTNVQQLVGSPYEKLRTVHIGHPSGVIEVEIETERKGERIPHILRVCASRTARRLAEGTLYLPERAVDPLPTLVTPGVR